MTTINRVALERCIAVINGKGGVLKTTLVANLGGMLAASGYRVLIVDLDPQGNLAEDLGYTEDERNDEGQALAAALMFGTQPQLLEGARENLDVLMGGPELDSASAGLAAKQAKNGFVFPGVGKLVVVKRKARMGRNPQTGEAIKIPAKTVLKFRIAKAMKELALK